MSMKKVTLFFVLIAVSLTFPAYAANPVNTPSESEKILRSEIISLIGDQTPFEIKTDDNVYSRVSFLLNDANELIVISVHSNREEIKSFLKGKLNHRTLKVKGIQKGKIYNLKFQFVPA